MAITYIKQGKPATLPPPTNRETKTGGNCNAKLNIIHAIVNAAKETKNKAVLKAIAAISLLGVIPGIQAAPEYEAQPICMRVASAINQLRAVRSQFKAIDEILTQNNL